MCTRAPPETSELRYVEVVGSLETFTERNAGRNGLDEQNAELGKTGIQMVFLEE